MKNDMEKKIPECQNQNDTFDLPGFIHWMENEENAEKMRNDYARLVAIASSISMMIKVAFPEEDRSAIAYHVAMNDPFVRALLSAKK